MAKTSETLDKAQQLAMEARIRAGMMVSDHRRSNLTRLRRAYRYAMQLARLAADLASTAFERPIFSTQNCGRYGTKRNEQARQPIGRAPV